MNGATTVAFAEALARGIELVGMGVMLVGGVAAFRSSLRSAAAGHGSIGRQRGVLGHPNRPALPNGGFE